jgi:insertion element IS1 protein InsB
MKREHATGKVKRVCSGTSQRCSLSGTQGTAKTFRIARFFTDGWGAYQRHLDKQAHIIGKSNTQTIERFSFDIADTD